MSEMNLKEPELDRPGAGLPLFERIVTSYYVHRQLEAILK